MFGTLDWVIQTPFGDYRLVARRFGQAAHAPSDAVTLAQVSFFARMAVERRDPTALERARALCAELSDPLPHGRSVAAGYTWRDDSQELARELESAFRSGRIGIEAVNRGRHRPDRSETRDADRCKSEKQGNTTASNPPLESEIREEVEPELSWIGVALVDPLGHPVPRRQFVMITPDQRERSGSLDELGVTVIKGIPAGTCQITFTDLESEAFSASEELDSTCCSREIPGAAGADSTGATVHRVEQGEHLAAVASRYGFGVPATLWNSPENAHLRQSRQDPCVLRPGDEVVIPEKREKMHELATGQRHTLQVYLPELTLRLRVLDLLGEPVPNTACSLAVGCDTQRLKTDGDGIVECTVPSTATEARLRVGDFTYDLDVGALDPGCEESGVRERLRNLGHFADTAEGADAERALWIGKEFFEGSQGQCSAQEPDLESPSFLGALVEAHGC